MAGYTGPWEVRKVLESGGRYNYRFTDTPWTVLSLAYGPDKRTDYWIAKALNSDAGTIRQARLAAVEICREIIHEYEPAEQKRLRIELCIENSVDPGESLTITERKILARGRKDRPKKGRKTVSGVGPPPKMPVAADVGETGSLQATQAEWVGKRSVEREQSLEQAAEAAEWKTAKLDEWKETA